MTRILFNLIIIYLIAMSTVAYTKDVSVANKYLVLTVDDVNAKISVLDMRNKYLWKTGDKQVDFIPHYKGKFSDLAVNPDKKEISFNMLFGWSKDNLLPCHIILKLDPQKPVIEAIMPAKQNELSTNIPFLEGFISDNISNGVMAVAESSAGHLYPIDLENMPGYPNHRNLTYYPTDRLDMAFVGITDKSGAGYSMIIDTSDDGFLISTKYKSKDKYLWAPKILWMLSKDKIAYDRKLIFSFQNKGGYVNICKEYRKYLKNKGYIVTLKEKRKINNNIEKLYGAVSVWGYLRKEDAKEMYKNGIKKVLLQRVGDWVQKTPESFDIEYINKLGYLTSEYDNYADMYPTPPNTRPCGTYGNAPTDSVVQKDGSLMNGWFDGKVFCQKRCPEFYARDAKDYVSYVLNKSPYNARFFDVVAAQDLIECYNPNHSLTKTQTRFASIDFYKTMRKLDIVVGSEHGVWWAVPYVDYFEGMQSTSVFAWSAAYLSHPKKKEPQRAAVDFDTLFSWDEYDRWGVGYYDKAPLWELVFHDCVISTWYWGDSNDWLFEADINNVTRKNLFNILYGTMPMMWTAYDGSWEKNKDLFYSIYKKVTPVTKMVAEAEMLSHEFITEDRKIQKTSFSNNTDIYVNFGDTDYIFNRANKKYTIKAKDYIMIKR